MQLIEPTHRKRKMINQHTRPVFDAIYNNISNALLVLDQSLRVLTANASYYESFQAAVCETEGLLLCDLGNGEWNIPSLIQILEAVSMGIIEIKDLELDHHSEALGDRTLKLNIRKILIENEPECLILLMIEDITSSKALVRKLEENISLLHFAMDTGNIGFWELDLQTMSLTASPRCKANFGLPTHTQLTQHALVEMIVPTDRAAMLEALETAIATKTAYNKEYRIEWPDGSWHWVSAVGKAVYNKQGNAITMNGILADITDRKDLEQKLRFSEQHFRTLSNSAPVMIAMSGPSGIFNFYNKEWLRFTGKGENTRQTDNYWLQDIHPDDLGGFLELQNSALRTRKRFNAELRLQQKGIYRWVSCNAIPRFEADNTFAGYTMACMDIHDQRMASHALERMVMERTEALRDANEELDDRNRELEQFAFVTSHDLQEPLRKIRMFISLLLSKGAGGNSAFTDYLKKIGDSASRMMGLIQDLQTYSSLHEEVREFIPTDLNKIVQLALLDLNLSLNEYAATVSYDALPTVEAVPSQMRQLFYILIGNALKFSKPETAPVITISAKILSRSEVITRQLNSSRSWCLLTISDNGIGFEQGFSEKIFVLFQRLHKYEQYKGNGIGLALCKRIVSNHDGHIAAHSGEDKGATFVITLPLHQNGQR